MGDELNLDDPMVREMADRNHQPDEKWTIGGRLIGVACYACSKEWPCPTRVALRDRLARGAEAE